MTVKTEKKKLVGFNDPISLLRSLTFLYLTVLLGLSENVSVLYLIHTGRHWMRTTSLHGEVRQLPENSLQSPGVPVSWWY